MKLTERIKHIVKNEPVTSVSFATSLLVWVLMFSGILKGFEFKVSVAPLSMVGVSPGNAFVLLTSTLIFFVITLILGIVLYKRYNRK